MKKSKQSLVPSLSKPAFLYRFEIYIPIFDNGGNMNYPREIGKVGHELMEVFGGFSFANPYGIGGLEGFWFSSESEAVYRDRHAICVVLAKQEPESISYFIEKKKTWEKIFKQEIILITLQTLQSL